MSPIDTYRDAFLRFLAEGMTYAEAMEQFDREAWNAALWEELEITGSMSENSLLDLAAKAGMERREEEDMQQAIELWMHGWTSEPVRPDSQVMSWYWRRPSRRPGRPGRLYLSTNQAWNAMKKEV